MLNDKELGQYLQDIRKKTGLSLRRVDELKGIAYSHLNMIEHGKRGVTPALLKNLADLYNVDYLDLYEKAGYIDLIEDIKKPKIKTIKIPILGYVRAGIPLEAVEEILDYEEIPEEWLKGGNEYFGLTIKGDSMFPFFIEGDTIIVKKQNTCENGEIAVVLVNGNDATVKEVKKTEDGISLIPYNRMYPPMNYTNEDIVNMPITIVGIFQRLIRDKK